MMDEIPHPTRTVLEQAERLLEHRRYEEAVTLCRGHLRQEPLDIGVRLALGRALMLLHEDHAARTEMVACLRVNARCAAAYRLLGELALRSDDYRRAEEYLRHAAALDPADPGADVLLSLVATMAEAAPPGDPTTPGAAPEDLDNFEPPTRAFVDGADMRPGMRHDTPRSAAVQAAGGGLAGRRTVAPATHAPLALATSAPGHATKAPHRQRHHGLPTRQMRQRHEAYAPQTPSMRIEAASRPGTLAAAPVAGGMGASRIAAPEQARSDYQAYRNPKAGYGSSGGLADRVRAPREQIYERAQAAQPSSHGHGYGSGAGFVNNQTSFSRLAKLVETLSKERPIHDSFSLRIVGSWSALGVVCVMLAWGAMTAVRSGKPSSFLEGAKAGLASFVQGGGPSLPPSASGTPGQDGTTNRAGQKNDLGDNTPMGTGGDDGRWMPDNMMSDTWIHPLGGPMRRMPIRGARVFGADRPGDRPFECQSGHCGVDIGEVWGEPVFAVHDGIIDKIQRGPNPDHGGKYVRIAHRNGTIISSYFHLASVSANLAVGMPVKAGQVVGLLGDTGVKHSSAHLHFAIAVRSGTGGDRYFDPEPLLAIWPLRMPRPQGEGQDGLLDHSVKPGVPLGAAWSHRSPSPSRAKKKVSAAEPPRRRTSPSYPRRESIQIN